LATTSSTVGAADAGTAAPASATSADNAIAATATHPGRAVRFAEDERCMVFLLCFNRDCTRFRWRLSAPLQKCLEGQPLVFQITPHFIEAHQFNSDSRGSSNFGSYGLFCTDSQVTHHQGLNSDDGGEKKCKPTGHEI
jgi:hypothetical protein